MPRKNGGTEISAANIVPVFVNKNKVVKMPAEALYSDPCAWRYFDYPIVGSIFRLPDIKSLVRGPTIVRLRTGREVRVPASNPKRVSAPAQQHDSVDANFHLQALTNMLHGRRGKAPGKVAGISYERRRHALPDNRIFNRPHRGRPGQIEGVALGEGADPAEA